MAYIQGSTLVFDGTTDTVWQTGHTLVEGDTWKLSVNCKSITHGGFTLAIDTPDGVGNAVNMGSVSGIVSADIIVPLNGDRFRISAYGDPVMSFDTFTAKKVDVTPPPVENDAVVNSYDLIWNDMRTANTGWVSNMKAGFPQFGGPRLGSYTTLQQNDYTFLNCWIEIEDGGDGTSCSPSINQANNTRVEIGWMNAYLLEGTTWTLLTETANATGTMRPSSGQSLFTGRGCCLDEGPGGKDEDGLSDPGSQVTNPFTPCPGGRGSAYFYEHYDYMLNNIRTTRSTGFYAIKPQYYYNWHCWSSARSVPQPHTNINGYYGVVWARLVVDNPNGPDDRHLANFVVHMGADKRTTKYVSGCGSNSKYKKITNTWQPIQMFFSNQTREQFDANPPPLIQFENHTP